MLWSLTFILIMAVTLGFMGMSYRFDHTIKSRRLKPLSTIPLVSILIPTYKAEAIVRKTLESAVNSDYPNKEIIVVNDSNDNTPVIARSYGAKVIQNTKRMGKGAAINKAAKAAKGSYLLLLDSDTILQKNTLTSLIKSQQMYENLGEKVGIVAPRYSACNHRNLFARLSDMEQRLHQNLLKIQMNLGTILSIRGSCLLIDRQAFDDVNGFSPTLLEDGDFTAKAIKAGYRIKYEPRAHVKIREPESMSALLSAKKRYGKGMFYCSFNHRRPYVISWQALVCFYPQFLLMLAVVGLLLTQNPLTLAPITVLLASFALTGISSYVLISLITALSVAGALLGIQAVTASTTAARSTLTSTILPFVLFFVPIITFAYARGFISGVSDKLNHRPELEFSNW